MITDDEIAELRRLAEGVVLPWSAAMNGMGSMFIRQRLPGRKQDSDVAQYIASDAHAAYIVAAANAIPTLLDEIEALRGLARYLDQ